MKTKSLVRAALIAALYVALTMLTQPIAFGAWQVRIAEAMTVLPFIMPEAIVGLTIGCLLSNILGGFGMLDIVFGTLATLLAAVLTYKAKKIWLAPVPPVIVNAIVIGIIVSYSSGLSQELYIPSMLTIGLGQLIACFGLGMPLLYIMIKTMPKKG